MLTRRSDVNAGVNLDHCFNPLFQLNSCKKTMLGIFVIWISLAINAGT